jgi:hypothetical protein
MTLFEIYLKINKKISFFKKFWQLNFFLSIFRIQTVA